MKKLITAATSGLSLTMLSASPVLGFKIDQPQDWVKYTEPGKLLGNIIGIIFIVAALIFFFMLLIGGVQWMLSGGDKGGTEAARGRITAALIGLVIVFAAWAIVTIVQQFFGITIVGGDIKIPTP